jgi:aspartate 1-decarboxylase
MEIKFFKSELLGTSYTKTDLNYFGYVAINPLLMGASNMIESEKVQIGDLGNGARVETDIITVERNYRSICLNGLAAKKSQMEKWK